MPIAPPRATTSAAVSHHERRLSRHLHTVAADHPCSNVVVYGEEKWKKERNSPWLVRDEEKERKIFLRLDVREVFSLVDATHGLVREEMRSPVLWNPKRFFRVLGLG
ncbi:hypothetical protein LR48_Vigan11g030300 [Vigna angularis]|uniref:Uncharacterized protein n=1 Tax=Phaseolus angularis TaxID=3914 RepID=A0A0L9VQC4_PHAAN|nr:hypothetical protein LR48_Vigan11g030300 [Vigna angularis]